MATLSFHGGAGTVTGSRHLLRAAGKALLVDCGMFQGLKELRERNWQPPGFDPRALDAVVLTHAHIDHSGWLPRLVREGFRGPIHATPATADLAELLLRDSAHIQEEDARYANEKGFSRHRPALPLYTAEDAERALKRFAVVDYGAWSELARGLRFRFAPAGHILGSGTVEVEVAEREPLTVLFSGDVGRYDAPLVGDPTPPARCDVLVIESTYGDRQHPTEPVQEQLAAALRRVADARGVLLVPSFAVGRAQQLLLLLHRAMEAEPRIAMPVHLDSPMAVDTTRIYRRYPEECGLEAVALRSGTSPIYTKQVFLHRTQEESIRLNALSGPRVIVSSSGMLTGGRVLHHLRRLAPQPENEILLVGYQAPGTRGRDLERGAPFVRVHGRDVALRARVCKVSGLSAHADQDQLLRWVRDLPPPRRTFVVHGEPDAARALAARLAAERSFACETPGLGDSFEL